MYLAEKFLSNISPFQRIRQTSKGSFLLYLFALLAPVLMIAAPTPAEGQTTGICNRTEQVRDALLDQISGVSDCAQVTRSHLRGITRLSLSGQSLTSLQAGDFSGLSKLTSLHLIDSALTSLPEGIFSNLSRLETLNLFRNRLTSLPDGIFSDLSNLLSLILSNNGLRSIDLTALFGGIGNLSPLRELFLDSNPLTSLPDDSFSDLPYLQTLHLSHSDLIALPDGIFSNLSKLTSLYLVGNDLISLPDGIFSNLPQLAFIDLDSNALTSLPDSIGNLSRLTDLYLDDNNLTSLPDGIFSNLSNLHRLGLSGNALISLPDSIGNLSRLTELYLDNNNLTSLPDGIFSNLTALDDLNLNRNPNLIWGVELIDEGLYRVKARLASAAPRELTIDLQATHSTATSATLTIRTGQTLSSSTATFEPSGTTAPVVSISSATFDSSRRLSRTLNIDAEVKLQAGICARTEQVRQAIVGKIAGVDNCARVTGSHLRGIGSLDVSGQSVSNLQVGDFSDLTGLQELRLSNNTLSELPEDIFTGLSQLRDLRLQGNQLTALPKGIFSGLPQLAVLRLSSNQLTSLPKGIFSGLAQLTRLYLSNNALTSLPKGIFSGLSTLTDLRLQSNQLSSLPEGIFSGLSTLANLRIHTNQLTALPDGIFSDLSQLRYLYLYRNNLSSLPKGIFSDLSQLTRLYLNINDLSSLPDGVFSNLTQLTQLSLYSNNPGLTWGVELIEEESYQVRARLASAAPRDLTIVLQASDSAATSATLIIPAGHTLSSNTATFEPNGDEAPEVSIDSATFDSRLKLYGTLNITATLTLQLGICGRTTGVWQAIVGQIDGVGSCNQVTDSHLRGIASLDVSGQSLASLQAGDFAGLTRLTELHLNNNSLSELPGGVFSDLSLLSSLHLGDNALTSLPDGVFSNLTALTDLSLDDNPDLTWGVELINEGFRRVRARLATATPRPLTINLSAIHSTSTHATLTFQAGQTLSSQTATFSANSTSSPLVRIDSATFDGLNLSDRTSLNTTAELELQAGICARTEQVHQAIVEYIEGVDSCDQVTETHLRDIANLYVLGQSLTSLQVGDFAGLSQLTELYLQNTNLTSLPDGIFSDLSRLATLSFGSSNLTSLPAGIFSDLPRLTHLHLNNNNLSSLPDGIFSNLPLLTDLRLNNNNLSALPNGIFSNLTALHDLDLSNNPGLIWGVELIDEGFYRVSARLATATPRPLTINLLATHSTTISAKLTIPAGQTLSSQTATFNTNGTKAPGVFINSTTFDGLNLPRGTLNTTAELELQAGICARTEQVRHAIVGQISGVDSCDQVTETQLGNMTSLDVSGQALASLQVGDFAGLSQLTGLHLDSSNLSALPEDIFSDLPQLTRLYLDSSLSSLPEGIFSNLSQLTSLYLYSNLSSLPEGIFSNLSQLRHLHLDSNNLSTLPESIFSNLTALTSLYLDNNNLSALPEDIFTGLPQLTDLRLQSNQLSSLPDGIFSNLSQLTNLNLADNNLTSLPQNVFNSLSQLSLLDLSGNQLATASPTMPTGLTADLLRPLSNRLATLRLHGNEIETLPDGFFEGVTSLTALSLQNQFDDAGDGTATQQRVPLMLRPTAHSTTAHDAVVRVQIPAGAPTELIVNLDTSSGTLSSDSVTIPAGSTLSGEATLRYTGDAPTISIPNDPNPGSNFTGLDWNTSATATPSTFADGSGRRANAGGLGFVGMSSLSLGSGICDRTEQVRDKLLELVNDGKKPDDTGYTQCQDVTSEQLDSLQTLDLSDASIDTLRIGDFAGLSGITTLNLSGSGLASLNAQIFKPLPSLVLSSSTGLPTGQSLNPSGDTGLTALTSLDLSANGLSTLPEGAFDHLPELTSLDLSGNDLSTLPEGIFDSLPELASLDLSGNTLSAPPPAASGAAGGGPAAANTGTPQPSLNPGLFASLTHLESLQLHGNGLDSLPDGLLANLDSLASLTLHNNPGAPFEFPMQLTLLPPQEASADIREIAAEVDGSQPLPLPAGVPLTLHVQSAPDGTNAQFAPPTTARVPATTNTLDITFVCFDEVPAEPATGAGCKGEYANYQGVRLIPGDTLVIDAHPSFEGMVHGGPQPRPAHPHGYPDPAAGTHHDAHRRHRPTHHLQPHRQHRRRRPARPPAHRTGLRLRHPHPLRHAAGLRQLPDDLRRAGRQRRPRQPHLQRRRPERPQHPPPATARPDPVASGHHRRQRRRRRHPRPRRAHGAQAETQVHHQPGRLGV